MVNGLMTMLPSSLSLSQNCCATVSVAPTFFSTMFHGGARRTGAAESGESIEKSARVYIRNTVRPEKFAGLFPFCLGYRVVFC